MSKFWYFILLNILSAYGNVDGNVKIIGGADTDIKEVPYQVALEDSTNDQYCGGVIISEKFILTAAHCLEDYDVSDVIVRAGSSLLEEGGQVIPAKKLTIHPKYDGSKFDHDYDVGIIELASAVKLDENSKAVAVTEGEVAAGSIVKISGWGITSNSGDAPKQFQSVEVPIIQRDECNKLLSSGVTDRMICGLLVGHNACNGDSGGPVVFNGTVVGVVSWSRYTQCAEENSPGVYSNIGDVEIRSFIKSLTGL